MVVYLLNNKKLKNWNMSFKRLTTSILLLLLIVLTAFSAFPQKAKYIDRYANSNEFYEKGVTQFRNEEFKKAKRSFEISLSYMKSRDAYYNLALANFKLGDTCSYCKNIKNAEKLGDVEAGKLFFIKCLKHDTINYTKIDLVGDKYYDIYLTGKCVKYNNLVVYKTDSRNITRLAFDMNEYGKTNYTLKDFFNTSFNVDSLPRKNRIYRNELDSNNKPYTFVEDMPEFTGGENALMNFLKDNIIYPQNAKENGVQGTVYITFIITASGKVTKAQVLKGIGGGCDEEALRVINKMPDWIPGRQSGIEVPVQYNLPIKFILQ
jgi:TonB family protein